jgi:uncharacterized protein DUF6228
VAVHDGIGHLRLRVTLSGRGWDADAWTASVTLRFDAGEDMRALAGNVARFLAGS